MMNKFVLIGALSWGTHFYSAVSLLVPTGSGQYQGEVVEKPPNTLKKPWLINLRRESVPVYRRGKIASFKTSYSGILKVGKPSQEFRVVFDTGSGHVVLPAAECQSESCLLHSSYNMTASSTSIPINSDGSLVPDGDLCEQVTIGFGTGQVVGEFSKDVTCLESGPGSQDNRLCMDMHLVVAVEMSSQPFKTFNFDGILGLGLSGLALTEEFSFFNMLSRSGQLAEPHFGVFLTDGENGEQSEIAIGGHNFEFCT